MHTATPGAAVGRRAAPASSPRRAAAAALLALAACADDPTGPARAPASPPRLTIAGPLDVLIEDLGASLGGQSAARAVDQAGRVVGDFGPAGAGAQAGVRWQNGNAHPINQLAGVRHVNDVDDAGRVVGRTAAGRAFFYDGGGAPALLADRPGAVGGEAQAINAAGQIAGTADGPLADGDFDEEPTDDEFAVLWPCPACAPTPIAFTPGGRGRARDVNAAGQVVGSAQTAGGQWHAFLWRDGVMTDLGAFSGGFSRAYGINDADEVVGFSRYVSFLDRAFFWKGGVLTDISPTGGMGTYALDVNNARQVTGYTYQTNQTPRHATRWTVTPRLDQTIAFPPIPDHTLGGPPFTLAATAPGGPVTYSLAPSSVGCALSGAGNATVTLTAVTPLYTQCHVVAAQAGNEVYKPATASRVFRVRYPFGFREPVVAPGDGPVFTVNSMTAGLAVPLRFSLGGYRGPAVLLGGAPTSQPYACGAFAADPVGEAWSPETPGLRYSDVRKEYFYVWNTLAAWAGTCRLVTLTLADGSEYTARFYFTAG
jgi:probable HAF family extracellular repeat protein